MRQKTGGKVLGILLSLVLVLGVFLALGASAWADYYEYVERWWDGDSRQVKESIGAQDCKPYVEGTLSGWYVVPPGASVTAEDRLTVSGEANIILCDGSKLLCEEGISVSEGNTLNIYGQSGGSGELVCEVEFDDDNAAIGSDNEDRPCGTVNIYGGKVSANGNGEYSYGAGIGGGDACDGGTIYIYGGEVNAAGGYDAAGIGGGEDGSGGTVTIYGGEVHAAGFDRGAGIGGGEGGSGGTITIYGGSVYAESGDHEKEEFDGNSAGIGGGEGGSGGTITIYGGYVEAKGGVGGAGIGGGKNGDGGTITINGGTVKADAYTDLMDAPTGAAIGGGNHGNSGIITITGGVITADAAHNGAGIGGGNLGNYDRIEITGGVITANAGFGGAGIGSGDFDGNRYGGTIVISGNAEVHATGSGGGAGIGGGQFVTGGGITISGNANVEAHGSDVPASTEGGAGIGGGVNADSGEIRICENATVVAYGGEGGAGIGGGNKNGWGGDGNYITIADNADVTAIAGDEAAGIGGGDGGDGGTINLNGGVVRAYANGDSSGAGIGGGDGGDGGTVNIYGIHIIAFGGEGGAGIGSDLDEGQGSVRFYRNLSVRAGADEGSAAEVSRDYYVSDHHQRYVEIWDTFTVRYDANGATSGTVPTDSHGYKYLDGATVLDNSGNLKRTDYAFMGWNTKADGSGTDYQPGESFPVTDNITLYAKWDFGSVPYMDWDGEKLVEKTGEEACKVYDLVTADTTALTDGKWYVVLDSVSIDSRITVNGTAHMIITDGATLDAKQGITVLSENGLILHGQSSGTGNLNAAAGDLNDTAGIGGGEYGTAGEITINGVNVTAAGGMSAAGIGGGDDGGAGTITINGGTITATGGSYGAGIGSGGHTGQRGSGGTITINGGTVTATGGNQAAGIGAGSLSGGYGGMETYVTVNGGTVNATGGNGAPGIGSGHNSAGSTVTLNGGRVTATAGGSEAGIGVYAASDAGTVYFNGSIVHIATEGRLGVRAATVAFNELPQIVLYVNPDSEEEHIVPTEERISTLTELEGTKYVEVRPGEVFTITFDTDGGSEIAPITLHAGDPITPPADPTKEGCTFAGWEPALPAVMPAENLTVKAIYEPDEPRITGCDLMLGGTPNFRFYVHIPEGFDSTGAYMTFDIHSKLERSYTRNYDEGLDIDGRKVFGCDVFSIEMAEPITAVFHYGEGKTVSKTWSVQDYLEKFQSSDPAYPLAAATRNYGHYMQPYLSVVHGFTYGTGEGYDYQAMPAASGIFPLPELPGYQRVWGEKGYDPAALSSVGYYDTFDQDTKLNIRLGFRLPPETLAVTVNGDPSAAIVRTLGPTDYLIEIPNIAANDLGRARRIEIMAGDKVVYDAYLSAMSYVSTVLAAKRDQPGEAEALTAFYEYYDAARHYGDS